jgi:hypothetical protein
VIINLFSHRKQRFLLVTNCYWFLCAQYYYFCVTRRDMYIRPGALLRDHFQIKNIHVDYGCVEFYLSFLIISNLLSNVLIPRNEKYISTVLLAHNVKTAGSFLTRIRFFNVTWCAMHIRPGALLRYHLQIKLNM